MYNENLKYRQGEILSKVSNNLNLKFAINQQLAATVDYENATNPYTSFVEGKDRMINNYYQIRLERPLQYLKQHKLVE